jgi:hypothetical protein
MQYNYETQYDLLSITNITFHINGEIAIENDGLKSNRVDPLTGHSKSYCSKITNQDLENFKYLFNLKSIEIIINECELSETYKKLVNDISNYFVDIGPVETFVYNIYNELIDNFNIGSCAKINFNENIQKYVYNTYNVMIYNIDEFSKFLNSVKSNNNKCLNELYDYRYLKLLNYTNELEKRIKILEEKINKSKK